MAKNLRPLEYKRPDDYRPPPPIRPWWRRERFLSIAMVGVCAASLAAVWYIVMNWILPLTVL